MPFVASTTVFRCGPIVLVMNTCQLGRGSSGLFKLGHVLPCHNAVIGYLQLLVVKQNATLFLQCALLALPLLVRDCLFVRYNPAYFAVDLYFCGSRTSCRIPLPRDAVNMWTRVIAVSSATHQLCHTSLCPMPGQNPGRSSRVDSRILRWLCVMTVDGYVALICLILVYHTILSQLLRS